MIVWSWNLAGFGAVAATAVVGVFVYFSHSIHQNESHVDVEHVAYTYTHICYLFQFDDIPNQMQRYTVTSEFMRKMNWLNEKHHIH